MKIEAEKLNGIKEEIEAELHDSESSQSGEKSKSESDSTIDVDLEESIYMIKSLGFELLKQSKGVDIPKKVIEDYSKIGAILAKKHFDKMLTGNAVEASYLALTLGIGAECVRQLFFTNKKSPINEER